MKLDERMKNYVDAGQHHLTSKVPVIINIKGRSYNKMLIDVLKVKTTMTEKEIRRLYNDYIHCFCYSAISVIKEMEGFKVAYVGDNEISYLLSDNNHVDMQSWFNYNIFKIISIVSGKFNITFNKTSPFKTILEDQLFQVKCFNIPEIDISNYFLWRVKDNRRNSLQTYCRQFFSPEEIHGKSIHDLNRMLFKKELDWNEALTYAQRNGIFMQQNKNGEINISSVTHTVTNKDIVYKDISYIIDNCLL